MNSSFYTAAAGAAAHQSRLDMVSNNMANISTTAYKAKNTAFQDLLYENYGNPQGQRLQAGNGVKISSTDSCFTREGAMIPSGGRLDFAIEGDGFFAVQDLNGEEPYYTRDGKFMISMLDDTMYLTNSSGQIVLDSDGDFIEMDDLSENATMEELNVGVYHIPIKDGLISAGYNNYSITEKNGEPEAIEEPNLHRGYLESSNVDMATEMAQIIETQRAFSFTLKMIQTSDEVEQEVNALRR